MLVPDHVVSLYVATSGASGQLLGSDEKEIILLVYAIIDVSINKVIGVQQYLVRPTGRFNSNLTQETETQLSGIRENTSAITGASSTTTAISQITTQPHSSEEHIITDSLLQVAGRPLNEIINKFDRYIRSLNIDPDNSNFCIITDGPLPLRQCLHPEASAKDIDLPSYYHKYSDLRKELVRYKSADLSRALISVKDINKLPNMPSLPLTPSSIADMMKELELTSYYGEVGSDFYIKESCDMITLLQAMIASGHKFEANEIINLNLEYGICSIDDEIDGLCIIRARGLPWQSSDQDIAKFFRGLNVAKGGVALCLSPQGRRNGEALVRFVSQEHRDMALKRHKHHIGNRYIEVYRASGEDFLNVAGGASNEAHDFLSKGASVIIRMRGLPYDCTTKQVLEFFTIGDNPCNVLDGENGILFVKKPDGRATGDAFVLFASESDAPKALSRHRESIGQRYIELFRSTTAEVQQVLNRTMDPKIYEPTQPLIGQIPSVQMPLLPQHVITSGTAKNCIRLRGLPYEARVEHILHFLEDFANNIIYQGVHMVYNAQGQPSGEAFIQMESEEAARASAQLKHNRFMVNGKKFRYIEVFQCSGDDMNLVLNGGIHSTAIRTKPQLLSPGMLSQTQQAALTQSHNSISLGIPSPLTLSIPPPNPAFIAQQQAQFIAQQNLLARQQVAAATTVAAQSDSQYFLPNLTLLHPHHQQTQPGLTFSQQNAYATPQFVFMPRATMPHFPPMNLIPTFHPTIPLAPPQQQTGIATSVVGPLMTNSIKRSYESAFQQDQTTVSSAKRHFSTATRPPTANIFAPFYPPTI